MKPKEIPRWVAIFAFGGFGLYILSVSLGGFVKNVAGHDWGPAIFLLGFTALIAGVPLAISYFAFRRDYRRLTEVVAAVGAVCVFGVLISLPNRLGVQDYLIRHQRESPWLIAIAFPVSILCLFGPFYAAGWFYRLCLRFSARYIHDASQKQQSA